MSHLQPMVANKLMNEFKHYTELKYSGKLLIKSTKGSKWNFYYQSGQIVWATGGTHPFRRWRRQMAQYCPEIDLDNMQLCSQDVSIDYWDYRLLESLYAQQKIKREQMNAVVENTIAELLFDLVQQANFSSVNSDRNQEIILPASTNLVSADKFFKLMEESWKNWSEAGLANLSPNLAPTVHRAEQLQQQVSSGVYKNFVTLINGKYTLLDLAVKMKQSVLSVSRSLLPYIFKGIIELVEVPDLPLRVIEVKDNYSITKSKTPTIPLIACVNDRPQVSEMLEEIIIHNGLRLINIQDAVHPLPILIEHKPDLIFLDLVLPVASGYEICAQLRRISLFANTPIIILTDSDRSLDRVRAKVVGSTDSIAAPLSADKVMGVVRKHIQPESKVKSLTTLDSGLLTLDS
ncbi:response regulator [Fischerella sp. PCC 9605]|uniref:response regulator n=1 Tax=Fischerella sp. PCC 9605 TaxID=1173024 RepID=UPI00047B9518|nr:response regulator [Fischerella sp. PCC 9605]